MMRRRRRRAVVAPEMNVTAFMNLMVVLIPFLLITAVFTRITWLDIQLPSAPATATEPPRPITLIVREHSLELRRPDGTALQLPRRGEEHSLALLREHLGRLKAAAPAHEGILLLVEPALEYGALVDIVDSVRVAPVSERGEIRYRPLFPEIAFGDAPGAAAIAP